MSETVASSYPGALDALLRIVDGTRRVEAEDLAALQNAVGAACGALGTGSKGTAADLATRLSKNLSSTGQLKECQYGVTTTSEPTFSVLLDPAFSATPKVAFAMSMDAPTANGAVIWSAQVGALGANFYGARRGGSTNNLDSVSVAWIIWNPNP